MMMSASNIQSAVEPQHRDDHNAAVSWSDRADDASTKKSKRMDIIIGEFKGGKLTSVVK
jgi:hypothetical protein